MVCSPLAASMDAAVERGFEAAGPDGVVVLAPACSSFDWFTDYAARGEAFKAAVQVRSEIMECHMVAGGFDYLLKTRMADMAAYRAFAGTVLWQLPGVRETRTYAVMEEVKSSARIPLPG